MTSKELREKRAPLAVEIRKMADLLKGDKKEFDAAEQERWVKINAEYDDLSRQIEIAERAETVDRQQASPGGTSNTDPKRGLPGQSDVTHDQPDGPGEDRMSIATPEQRALAIQGWMRFQMDLDLEQRHVEACQAVGIRPSRRELILRTMDTEQFRNLQGVFVNGHPAQAKQRAQSHLLGSGGAVTIPMGFMNRIEVAMLQFGGVRQVAEVIRTESGEDLPWPTVDDTSNQGEQVGENTEVGTQDVTFGATIWRAYKKDSKMILVPYELLQDSAVSLEQIIGDIMGERLGRKENVDFTTGTGAGQPRGIVTAAAVGVTTASATAITADEILELIHSVDPAYRVGAGWMMNDQILLYVRKLKDGQGQYLWASGLNSGVADSLGGYPITINNDMQSSVASATRTMLFGLLSKYKIRDVGDIRIKRLVERYGEKDQEGFIAFKRSDGNLLNAGTNPVKCMLQKT